MSGPQAESFVSYRRFRWLWLTVVALLGCAAVYWVDSPLGGRNGGTPVGYTLGALATVGIVVLMLFGVRKRAYRSRLGTVEGWLAAHVWIGIGLLFLVPLHAGFSFGWNVHTLAYALMVVTVVSGIWGAMNYTRLSAQIESHRGGLKAGRMAERILGVEGDLEALLAAKSDALLSFVRKIDVVTRPGLLMILRPAAIPQIDTVLAAKWILELPEVERDDARAALALIDQKCDLSRALGRESHIKMLLRIWLFVHVPASIALCGAVAVHIFSVFFFW